MPNLSAFVCFCPFLSVSINPFLPHNGAVTIRLLEGRYGLKILGLLQKISLRDVLLVSGLASIGVGLYLFAPWLSFTVVGCLLLGGGFLMREAE